MRATLRFPAQSGFLPHYHIKGICRTGEAITVPSVSWEIFQLNNRLIKHK